MDLVEVASWRSASQRSDLVLAAGERVVAGGTWLFSEPQPGTTGLVDLTTLGWDPWQRTGTGLELGATCTVEQLLAMPEDVLGGAAALARACADAFVMSFKIAHTATLGGNVALALPAGAMTSLLVALGATAVVWGPGGDVRRQPVADLVTGARATTLAADEVLRAFEVPAASLAAAYAFRRQSLAPHGRSGVVVTASRPTADAVRLVVSAATTRPVVLALPVEGWRDRLATDLAALDCWYDDAHGATDWRAAMALRLAGEAVAEVLAR
ncbi:hypothetical protein ASG49_13340 [Marmoricola sp. Leaf446]|uniref:FAD binding domain-containing protein n=1 Tax=Marmoricola sp. Leaf446 TaxID=1736379 RepID=UPI0006F4072E|nr:FAD binding domain-containing protein [Marmoricola sp. Leaf446]KQT90730.1 hypothetical protein ASG49_13340 [Marmoricola sp. Leaf446]